MHPINGRLLRALAVPAFGAFFVPVAGAQERLTGARTVSGGLFMESYSFGGGLAQQAGFSGQTSIIKSATQWVFPISMTVPLGDRWSADIATVITNGTVRFAPTAESTNETTATLSGVGDVRVRATGRLVGDRLLLTIGANLGTGVRELTPEQVAVLGVLAAPALGSASPAASAGSSFTSGLVYAFQGAGWAWAAGASLELRESYSPVAALTAGIPAPTFDPGPAVHLTLGSDGFVGDGGLSVALTADVYTQDRLVVGSGASVSRSSVKLGPMFGADVQWRAPATRFREVVLYAAEHYRTAFTRAGETVSGTSASYASAGAHTAYPLGHATDLTSNVDVWVHSGLSVERSLVTAKAASGALGVGLAHRFGTYELQPYVRFRLGSIDTGAGSANVTGRGIGVNLSARF